MPKKKDEEEILSETEIFGEPELSIEEEAEKAELPIESPKMDSPMKKEKKLILEGIKCTVYRVGHKDVILIDERGNGKRIPLTEEYKKLKKGDIIYL